MGLGGQNPVQEELTLLRGSIRVDLDIAARRRDPLHLAHGLHAERALEIVHNGNERAALFTLRTAKESKQLYRVILGTDAPAGSGVQPLGILRVISALCSVGEIPAEVAFCFATGNTARMRKLDTGLIEVGRAADFVFLDAAQHSAGKTLLDSVRLGDLPGVGMVVIDGEIKAERSRNTPPATRLPKIIG